MDNSPARLDQPERFVRMSKGELPKKMSNRRSQMKNKSLLMLTVSLGLTLTAVWLLTLAGFGTLTAQGKKSFHEIQ